MSRAWSEKFVPESLNGVLNNDAASESPGSTPGNARRRLGVGAGGERRIVFEDAYVVLRVPITAVGSVTLPWAASHSFVDLRT